MIRGFPAFGPEAAPEPVRPRHRRRCLPYRWTRARTATGLRPAAPLHADLECLQCLAWDTRGEQYGCACVLLMAEHSACVSRFKPSTRK